ncbi:DUF2007 domain-containing protein [Arenibacter sp. GZD96]|uniref:putative signal transducing protein n=1 Tax=Aurantibrevibacter litoralis TaxID=3106030 RepID=UPI002AFF7583|nr:DUF2007 domain-containing protein [Arenibacter sp. GZD-96]MEA1787235.1 DUF2007 domain-containing protein [Arenibacter sp. GZD-96]
MKEKFFVLGAFEYVADVEILKGKLTSEGIAVFLKDENIVNADPLISNAIGGVKVMVYEEDAEQALRIYNTLRNYAVDAHGHPIICPNCKAARSESYYARRGVFYKLFPFFEKRKYKCLNCNMITNPLHV